MLKVQFVDWGKGDFSHENGTSTDPELADYMYDLREPEWNDQKMEYDYRQLKNHILETLYDLWFFVERFHEENYGVPICLKNQGNINFKKLNLKSDSWKNFILWFRWQESDEMKTSPVLLIDNWGICMEIIRNYDRLLKIVQYIINDTHNMSTSGWYDRKELEVSLPKLSKIINYIRDLSILGAMRERYKDELEKTMSLVGINLADNGKKDGNLWKKDGPRFNNWTIQDDQPSRNDWKNAAFQQLLKNPNLSPSERKLFQYLLDL